MATATPNCKFTADLLSLENGNSTFSKWEADLLVHSFSKKCGDMLLEDPSKATREGAGYSTHNNMVKGFIFSGISPMLRLQFVGALRDNNVSAWAMMEALKDLCTDVSPVAILNARTAFDNSGRLQPGQPVSACLDIIDQKAADLAYLGHPVDRGVVALMYLKAIKKQHPSFVDQFHGGSETTTVNIRHRLAFQAGLADGEDEHPESAFSANTVDSKGKEVTLESLYAAIERMGARGGGRGGGQGGGRGASGRGGGGARVSERNQERYDKGVCFNCGGPGHIAADCTKPKKPLPDQGAASNNKSPSVYTLPPDPTLCASSSAPVPSEHANLGVATEATPVYETASAFAVAAVKTRISLRHSPSRSAPSPVSRPVFTDDRRVALPLPKSSTFKTN
jgi:hypothetical protein